MIAEYNPQQPNLDLTVLKDHNAIADAAANRIAQLLRDKPNLVVGLATGATMLPIYKKLIAMHLDVSRARFFNLDNYEGLEPGNRNAYDHQLREIFLKPIGAREENIHLVPTVGFSPKEYEAEIKKAGGIDVQLLGLGGEGHIGFNEVGSSFNSHTRRVKLSARTREDNSIYFNRPGEKVPTHAYTMGIGTILKAKEIIMLANGAGKAWTLRNMMDPTGTMSEDLTSHELYHLNKVAPLDEQAINDFFVTKAATRKRSKDPVRELPARALHAHCEVQANAVTKLLVDEEAASMTRVTDLAQHSNLKGDQITRLLDRFTPKEVTVKINGADKKLFLPFGFDFFDPETMKLDEKFDPANPRHLAALGKALENATDVAVGAHQDDVEIMAGPILLEATTIGSGKKWLSIIVTDGAAAKNILNGDSTKYTAQELTDMRQLEQRRAAAEEHVPVIQLKYPSAAVNGFMGEGKKREAAYALRTLFACMPELQVVYGHNPLDKHPTHVATFAVQTCALRAAKNKTLKNVCGLEVWGGLSGIPESMLSMFPVESSRDLTRIRSLIEIFQSQIELQGRDYADASIGRISGHGGFVTNPHLNNPPPGMVLGIDVTDFTRGNSNDMGALTGAILRKAAHIKKQTAAKHPVGSAPSISGTYTDLVLGVRGKGELKR